MKMRNVSLKLVLILLIMSFVLFITGCKKFVLEISGENTVEVGETIKLTTNYEGNERISWNSSNQNIATVATKEGFHGAVISAHPGVTDPLIEEEVKRVLSTDLKNNLLELPKHFDVEIQYKRFNDAYNASFYPGCKLISSDTIMFSTDDYYEVVRALKFIL